jgi:hypothetical protein
VKSNSVEEARGYVLLERNVRRCASGRIDNPQFIDRDKMATRQMRDIHSEDAYYLAPILPEGG